MAAEVSARLGLHINTTGLDQLARVEKALAGITRAANTNVAASQHSTSAAVKAGQAQEMAAIRVQRTSAAMAGKQADMAEKTAIRIQLTSARMAQKQIDSQEKAQLASARMAQKQIEQQEKIAAAAERKAERERRAIRTVETEMERLVKIEERRKLTQEANVRLNRPSGFFAGHGFVDKARGMVGGVRDLTVAGMGMYYTARAGMHLAHAVIDPVREYQFELAKLKSKQGFSAEAMADINKAIRSNRDSVFTPQQAAEAGTTLAAAGVGGHGHHENLISALQPTLKFAQAANMGSEEAAHMFVETANQFGLGLNGKAFERVGNALVGAKEQSTATFEELSESLKYVGPVANAVHTTLEHTAGMLALLAEGGIKGSTAGTGLAAVFSRLSRPRKLGMKALGELGLSEKDTRAAVDSGDLQGFFAKVGTAMDKHKFSPSKRLALMGMLFGEEAQKTALELSNAALKNNGQLWEQINHNIDKAGEGVGMVNRMADTLGDTLEMRIRKVDAKWELFKLNLGEKMLPSLEKAMPKVGNFVDKMSDHITGTSGTGLVGEAVGVAVGVGLARALITGLTTYMAGAGAASWASAWAAAGGTAGVPFTAALGGAVLAGVAGWGLGSALARALKIDVASQEGTVRGERGLKGAAEFVGSAADSTRRAGIKAKADTRAAAFEDVAGFNEKPISSFSGELHIKIDHEGKPKVHRLVTKGAPLDVGVSVTR